MGATLSVMGTLFIPALVALLAYLLLTFAVVPAWQHYRNRYSHYLPIDTITHQTSSLRHRMQAGVGRFFARTTATTTWRQRTAANGGDTGIGGRLRGLLRRGREEAAAGHNDDELLSDDDDVIDLDGHDHAHSIALGEVGEELGAMRHGGRLLRQELPRGGAVYDTRRLSRELEQGFMDDSDEDDEAPRR